MTAVSSEIWRQIGIDRRALNAATPVPVQLWLRTLTGSATYPRMDRRVSVTSSQTMPPAASNNGTGLRLRTSGIEVSDPPVLSDCRVELSR